MWPPSPRPRDPTLACWFASRHTVLVPPTSIPRTCIPDILPFMLVLSGADVVLPDEVRSTSTLVVDGDRIVALTPGARPAAAGAEHFDLTGHLVVPGFIDVH